MTDAYINETAPYHQLSTTSLILIVPWASLSKGILFSSDILVLIILKFKNETSNDELKDFSSVVSAQA